jgi:hypothetical protein
MDKETITRRFENFAKASVCEFESYTGILLSVEEVLKVMNNPDNIEFYLEEIEFPDAYEEESSYGLDTYPREVILNDLAKELIGMSFPCNGDLNETKELFLQKLVTLAKEKNV